MHSCSDNDIDPFFYNTLLLDNFSNIQILKSVSWKTFVEHSIAP